jgi:phosphatidylinositol alpha-mannosyltransferase
MRIVLTCPYSWDAPGGVQVHVRELAVCLRSRGHEVLVLAPGERAALDHWVRVVGRPVRVPYHGTVAPICFSWSSWRRVRGSIRRFSPEVVHAHEPMTPSTSMLAVLAGHGPVVATFHSFLDRSRLLELAAPALRPVWRRIDARIAVSGAAASFLARAFPGEVEIVPNGVAVERFAEPHPAAEGLPAGRRLLWVNRLDPQKGFPVMVRAFQRLSAEFADLSLVVAGDGRDRGALRLLPPEQARRVLMLGTVPHDRLPAYHAGADVFASPALGQESFGMVLVEAMAAGVPVVATDIPGYRDVVRHGVDGLLVPPNDPNSLARAIASVLREPALADRLAAAGRARAMGYSWEVVVPRIEDVYRRAAGPV